MSIEELLQITINSYIENYIINLDLSDSTKNILKRQLRRGVRDMIRCINCKYFLSCKKASEDIIECNDYEFVRKQINRYGGITNDNTSNTIENKKGYEKIQNT